MICNARRSANTSTALLAVLALTDLAYGCATTKAAATTLDHAADKKIQIVFDDATGTDYFICKSGKKRDCTFIGPYAKDRFQQSGTIYVFVPADCRGSFLRIQIEKLDGKPEAHVVCAQPVE